MSSAIPQFQFVPELPDPPEYVFTPSPAYPPAWIVDRIEAGLRTLWWLFRYNLVLFYWIFLYPQAFPVYVRRIHPAPEHRRALIHVVGWMLIHTFITPFTIVVSLLLIQTEVFQWKNEQASVVWNSVSLYATIVIGAGGILAVIALGKRGMLPALGLGPVLTIPLAVTVFLLRPDILGSTPILRSDPWYIRDILPAAIVGVTIGLLVATVSTVNIVFTQRFLRNYSMIFIGAAFSIFSYAAYEVFVIGLDTEDCVLQQSLSTEARHSIFFIGLVASVLLTKVTPLEWLAGTLFTLLGIFPRPRRFGPFHRTFVKFFVVRYRLRRWLDLDFESALENVEALLMTSAQFEITVSTCRSVFAEVDDSEGAARIFATGYWQNINDHLWRLFCRALATSPTKFQLWLWNGEGASAGIRNWEPEGPEAYRQIAAAFWDMSNGNLLSLNSTLSNTSVGAETYAMSQALRFLENIINPLTEGVLDRDFAGLFQAPVAQYIAQTDTHYIHEWTAVIQLRDAAHSLWLARATPVSDPRRDNFIQNARRALAHVAEGLEQGIYHRTVRPTLNNIVTRWLRETDMFQQDTSSEDEND